MRYGLNIPTGGVCANPRTQGESAALAEAAGWDGIFLEDYLVYQNRQDIPTYDPWVSLAVMGLRTERILLGTEVTPVARRRPWKLARETVTLDHLSGGRLVLGVGLGSASDLDFANFSEQADCGPVRRALRWDGACLYRAAAPGSAVDAGSLGPNDVRELKRLVESLRGSLTGFDIVVGARKRNDDWEHERNLIRDLADAGATWWFEWVPPADEIEMRTAIMHGPLRIE